MNWVPKKKIEARHRGSRGTVVQIAYAEHSSELESTLFWVDLHA